MIDKFEIVEILNHIFGISFTENGTSISFDDLHSYLEEMGVDLEKVIFSIHKDSENVIWIIAANKYYDEDDALGLIKFIVMNNLFEEYFLGV